MTAQTVKPQNNLVAARAPPPQRLLYLPLDVLVYIISQLDPARATDRHTLTRVATASRALQYVAEHRLYTRLSLDPWDIRALADADEPLRAARRRKVAAARFVRLVSPFTREDMDVLYALARAGDGPLFPAATAVHLVYSRQVLFPRMALARLDTMPPPDVLIFTSPRVCVDSVGSHTLLKHLPCASPPQITSHFSLESFALRHLVPAWKSYTVFDHRRFGKSVTSSMAHDAVFLGATRRGMPPIELRVRSTHTARQPKEEAVCIPPAVRVRFYSAAEARVAEGCPVCGMAWKTTHTQFEEQRAKWMKLGLVAE